MIKSVLLAAALLTVVGMGLADAQEPAPVAGSSLHPYAKEIGMARIVTLKDRIKSQRDRITAGLNARTLASDQALTARATLDAVEDEIRAERKANGRNLIMTRDNYDAYNTSLDANSNLIGEQKQFFYYYGPYAESGDNYSYYYDSYAGAGAPTPSVSAMEKSSPRIFEVRERIKAQRARIQQYLDANTLTNDQAANCGLILNGAAKRMKTDFVTNGSNELTRKQYVELNTALDANSVIIQESKQAFYFYNDPESVQYY
jgi:hypothetical protein